MGRGIETLKVTVRLFAGHRERVGEALVELELPQGASVGYLAKEMLRRFPGLAPDPERLVVAVNQEYVDHLHPLDDGDETALIPPVSGGFLPRGVWRYCGYRPVSGPRGSGP